jgi:hypothetical protein
MVMSLRGARPGAVLLIGLGMALASACTSNSSNNDAGGAGGTTGGASGSAGTGGVTGGAAGTGGSTGGAAGADAGPGPAQCKLKCSSKGDCLNFTSGTGLDFGLSCKNGSCTGCNVDEDCIPSLSNWLSPCTKNSECGNGLVCIDVAGAGRCAKAAPLDGGLCAPPDGPAVIPMPLEDGGNPYPVCAHTETAWCHNGECAIRCIDSKSQPLGNAICLAYVPGTSVCDPKTGECGCNLDSDCVDGLKCVNKRCGCKTDGDCAQSIGKKCVQGYCSCSDVNDCAGAPKLGFDLLAPSCEPVTP